MFSFTTSMCLLCGIPIVLLAGSSTFNILCLVFLWTRPNYLSLVSLTPSADLSNRALPLFILGHP